MRPIFRTLCIAATAMSVCAAHAIDKSSPKLLMDNGFGSEAVDGWTDYIGVDFIAVGHMFDVDGKPHPGGWQYDLSTRSITEIAFPAGDGFYGRCHTGRSFTDGVHVAVGEVTAPNGRTHAVVWRGITADDDWEAPIALAPGAVASICGHEIAHGVQADVPGAILQQGRWRPVIFIKVNVDIAHTLLPLPNGAQGQALTIDGEPGARIVGGWIQMPGGQRSPALWGESGVDWFLMSPGVPSNTVGQINSVTAFPSGHSWVGDIRRNGRIMGIYSNNIGGGLLGLKPLDGFMHSSGLDTHNLGDTGTHEVGHLMGLSSNANGLPVATGWLPQGDGFAPYAAQQFLLNPSALSRVVSMRLGRELLVDCTSFGTVVPSPGAAPQACLFLASGRHAPDRLDVPAGRGQSTLDGVADVVALAQEDGEVYALRSERFNGTQMACLDLSFNPLSFSAGQDARMDTKFTAPNQVTGGVINVYFYSLVSGRLERVASKPLVAGAQTVSVALPGSASDWQEPQTGRIRARLEFRYNGNPPRTVAIETVEIAHEG